VVHDTEEKTVDTAALCPVMEKEKFRPKGSSDGR